MSDTDSVQPLQDDFDCDAAEDSDDMPVGGDEFADCDSDESVTRRQQKSYTILSEEGFCQRQEDDIISISSMLRISRADAGILLRHCNWSVTKLLDEWFSDKERILKAVGLQQKPVVEFLNEIELTCGICFEAFPRDEIYTVACGHPFCSSCWAGYISAAVTDGPGCLMLKCPVPTCDAAVGEDHINLLSSEDVKGKYARYFQRSYIEDNRKVKWCPAPDCDYAVDFDVGSGSYDVTCLCSYSFCWNCTEEAHRPIDCETVDNWILKHAAVSEHMSWISANSKQCPDCRVPIKKDQGSMHITCMPPCNFEFCWICLGPWTEHGERTDGFYSCNCYETAKQGKSYDESEKRMAKNSLERYTHYYERWAANQSSRQKAMEDLKLIQDVHLKKLSEMQCQPDSQLKFITEAWSQIVDCRRVLKWTYPYGYYLPKHEDNKRQFFEYLQGEAEANLERLHHCAEKEMHPYLLAKNPSRDFNEFRKKLANLTSVTKDYFKKLVEALENGLSDVESQGETAPSRTLGGGSSSRRVRKVRADARISHFSGPSRGEDYSDCWSCDLCTFPNPESASVCQMCHPTEAE